MANTTMIEFRNAARDTRVKGDKRLLVITEGSTDVILEVKGEAIDGHGLFTISTAVVALALYNEHKDLILSTAKAAK